MSTSIQPGTMRGKVVYAYHAADGELLTWFGRDPDFEDGNDRVRGAHPDRLKRAHLGLENGRSGQER